MKSSSLLISRRLIYLLFFFSGFTGLVYEIAWSRILSTILGNTSLAITVVVSIFLGGLALGSFSAPRIVFLQNHPLRTYAILELFIAGYAICTPMLASWIDPLYSLVYSGIVSHFWISILVKAFFAAILFLLPSVAMGATLPVLVRCFSENERRHSAGFLYGINTAGAVFGTLSCGYVLLPQLGISSTISWTALVNVCIALLAILIAKRVPQEVTKFQAAPKRLHPAYVLVFFTGFASLAYEILWTRALSMFFGSSVYAFSSILAAFLLGIASGSSYYSRRIPDEADPYQFFSFIQFRISLAAIFFLGVFMGIPYLLIRLYESFHQSFPLFQAAQFILIGATVFYASFVSGAAFPAALHFFRSQPKDLQRYVSNVYTFNTIGSILGSIAAGFFMIPWLGVERSIRLMGLLNLILGMICFRKSPQKAHDKKVLAIGGVCLALLLLLPRWNQSIYNSGFYAFAYKYVPKKAPRKSVALPAEAVEKFGYGFEVVRETVPKLSWSADFQSAKTCNLDEPLRARMPALPLKAQQFLSFGTVSRATRPPATIVHRLCPAHESSAPHFSTALATAPQPKWTAADLFPRFSSSNELRLIYYGEGLTATVAVVEQEQKTRSLLINGKPDASNVPTGDMRTQLLLGHLPVLMKGKAEDVLVIGLGSGVTSGAFVTHGVRRIDSVEIEKKVAEAARFFNAENLWVLDRKIFRLVLDDGRNFIRNSPGHYDVITSEPSNLWMSGVANLFTREFFLSAKEKLNPGGLMCQWIHLYQISLEDVLIFLKTFHSVFPHLSVWIDESDMLVLGSARPMVPDLETLRVRMAEPAVAWSMRRSAITPEYLMARYVGNENMIKILHAGIPLNVDDHPILEFSAPRSLFVNHAEEISQSLIAFQKIAERSLVIAKTPGTPK